MALKEATDVRAECGVVLHEGDRAYSHLIMRPGVIEAVGTDGWFHFRLDDGSFELLNGERVVSLPYAKRRGFAHAS